MDDSRISGGNLWHPLSSGPWGVGGQTAGDRGVKAGNHNGYLQPPSGGGGGGSNAPGGGPPGGQANGGGEEAAEQWFEELRQYETTLEEMAQASMDPNFKEELSAIEQWFHVLSEAERTAALYSLLQSSTPLQMRFFIAVLQQMTAADPLAGGMAQGATKVAGAAHSPSAAHGGDNALRFKSPGAPSASTHAAHVAHAFNVPKTANPLVQSFAAQQQRSPVQNPPLSAMPASMAARGNASGLPFANKGRAAPFSTTDMFSEQQQQFKAWSERQMNSAASNPLTASFSAGNPMSRDLSNDSLHKDIFASGPFARPRSAGPPAVSPQQDNQALSALVTPIWSNSFEKQQVNSTPGNVGGASSLAVPGVRHRVTSAASPGASQQWTPAPFDTLEQKQSFASQKYASPLASQAWSNAAGTPTYNGTFADSLGDANNGRANILGSDRPPASSAASVSSSAQPPGNAGSTLGPWNKAAAQQDPIPDLSKDLSFVALDDVKKFRRKEYKDRGDNLGASPGINSARLGVNGFSSYSNPGTPSLGVSRDPSPVSSASNSKVPSPVPVSASSSLPDPSDTSPSASAKSAPPEPVDMDLIQDVPAWLRSLRLHKYIPNLDNVPWTDLIHLSEADLEARGVSALGARRKLLKVFEQVKQQTLE